MDRRGFLRRMFGAGAAVAASGIGISAKDKDGTVSWEDLTVQCTGNENLFYLKPNGWLNKELVNAFGDKVVDRQHFNYYYPVRDILIPIKETYTKEEFGTFILWAKSQQNMFNHFCNGIAEGTEMGICRFFRDWKIGAYVPTFFAANNPKKGVFLGHPDPPGPVGADGVDYDSFKRILKKHKL